MARKQGHVWTRSRNIKGSALKSICFFWECVNYIHQSTFASYVGTLTLGRTINVHWIQTQLMESCLLVWFMFAKCVHKQLFEVHNHVGKHVIWCTKKHIPRLLILELLGSWDIKHNRVFLLLWAIFWPLALLITRKIKILKKWKRSKEISSFNRYVTKIMITWCMVPETWYMTDGWAEGWKRQHIEVDAPPKNLLACCTNTDYNTTQWRDLENDHNSSLSLKPFSI